MLKRNALFEELVPVRKADYDRWRIKTEFREHNPIYAQLLQVHDEITALKDRKDVPYEEKLRLDAILRNQQATLRSNLPATDPFFMKAAEASASAPTAADGAPTPTVAEEAEEAEAEELPKMPPLEGELRSFKDALGRAIDHDIPPPMQEAADAVIAAASAHPDILAVNDNDEVVINGKALRGTDASRLLQSLYWRPRGWSRRGTVPFMRALGRIGVPAALIHDVDAQAEYAKATGAQPSPRKQRAKKGEAQEGKGAPLLSVVAKKRKSSSSPPPGKRVRILRLYK